MNDMTPLIALPSTKRRHVYGWPRTGAMLAVALLAGLAGLAPARANDDELRAPAFSNVTGVIELFSSQGCSLCPPADALIKSFADKPGVLALAMPVDYWDHLGWKDTLGSSKHSERQRSYAKARGDGKVYTPQAVINGLVHVNGASAKDIENALAESQAQIATNRIPLRFWTNRGHILIEMGGSVDGAPVKEAVIWLAVIQKSVDVTVTEGENRGKTLTYTNVVRELTSVGTWTGQPLRIQLARSALMRRELQSVAVIVQQGKAGPILAAAVTGLW